MDSNPVAIKRPTADSSARTNAAVVANPLGAGGIRNPWVGLISAAASAAVLLFATPAVAQVRGKRPDRGTYQSPTLEPVALESLDRRKASSSVTTASSTTTHHGLQPVAYNDVDLVDPVTEVQYEASPYQPAYEQGGSYEVWEESPYGYDPGDACDGLSCDGIGCDGGCDGQSCDGRSCGSLMNASLSRRTDQWFGSLELLTMFRGGDRLPVLVTTGADDATADSQPLFGGQTLLDEITAGGRITIGTWIDPQHCRSLVLRGWTATEADFGFFSNQDQNPVLGLPFFNSGDGTDDVQIVASPDRANGSVTANGSSNVFGGDLSVRQHWFGRYGANVDLLYGYQYMRLSEDLTLNRSSVSLADDFAPVGSILSVTDAFDIDNEFHGGQFGIAGHYREGCWSFSSLAKVGFGSLRRRAELSGETLTSIDGLNAVDPQGIHVRDSNSGVTEDNTFGWVPELDFSLGYHKFPNYELTIGYHIIAMTDALRVSGALDPNLASNLTDPLVGPANPVADFRFDTFYVQGIHFGIQYVR